MDNEEETDDDVDGDYALSGKQTHVKSATITVYYSDGEEIASDEVSLGATLILDGYVMSGSISVSTTSSGTLSVSIDGGEAESDNTACYVTESTASVVVTVTEITSNTSDVEIKVTAGETTKTFTVSQDDLETVEGEETYTATIALRWRGGLVQKIENHARKQIK